MSAVEGADGHQHEIIIVRHGGGDHDDGHHGGAWKIAFADFMTAMMCFFLVMWLINAANEQTKAAVASYFNPVKLIDRNSSRKGLEDIGDGPNAVGTDAEKPQAPESTTGTFGRANAGPESKRSSDEAVKEMNYSDEHLFADPFAVLAEIASESGVKANISAKGEGGASDAGPANGAAGGQAYRDPFAPDFWTQPEDVETPSDSMFGSPRPVAAVTAGEPTAEAPKAEAADPVQEMIAASQENKIEEVIAVVKPEERKAAPVETGKSVSEIIEGHSAEAKAGPAGGAGTVAPPPPSKVNAAKELPAGKAPEDHSPSAEAMAEAKDIKMELAKALGTDENLEDGLSVVATEQGVTISVTDEFDFGMFEVGSALPRRELVLAMEKIAGVIKSRGGSVTVNGHTDARPFKSEKYDNWRLSSARAHSAYYMLVRAGLDEKRVTEVGGFADRKLKNAADPFDAANRRIEILLEVGR